MGLKRIITEEEKALIKPQKKFKGKNIKDLSQNEKDELLEIVAKKLNIL